MGKISFFLLFGPPLGKNRSQGPGDDHGQQKMGIFLFTYTISYSALPEPAHNICYKVTHRTIIHWPF